MKRILLVIFLIIPSIALADRITVTINIPAGHTSQEYIDLFVRKFPVPTDDEGSPIMTSAEWVNKRVLDWFNRIVQAGAYQTYQETLPAFVPPESARDR